MLYNQFLEITSREMDVLQNCGIGFSNFGVGAEQTSFEVNTPCASLSRTPPSSPPKILAAFSPFAYIQVTRTTHFGQFSA